MTKNRFTKRSSKIKKSKEDFQSILMEASKAHSEGRLKEAENGYLKVLKNKPAWGRVLNAIGTVYLDQGVRDKAKRSFKRAANLRPPNVSACYNLARLLQQEGDQAEALVIYKRILKQQPDNGQVWNNLGVAHREMGNRDEGIVCFEEAVKFAPGMAEAWNNLGVAQDDFNRSTESTSSYQKAIEISPDYTSAHFNLGSSLQKLKQFEKATKHYNRVLEIQPDDEAATFMLQSLGTTSDTPDSAPAEHVRRIFDQCAGTFEKILVTDLEYKTPEILFNLVRPHLSTTLNVLDLGCGTGLGAQFYRPFANRLTGVDVSPKMLERAEEKNIYDELRIFDILQDWDFPEKFNLIYSSDVFVYLGNLDPVFKSISSYLTWAGIITFSVEKLEEGDENYKLYPSGRYAHSQNYIEQCLDKHDLQLTEAIQSDIRKESGKQVKGLLFVAQKTQ